jgi:hypothetical protein
MRRLLGEKLLKKKRNRKGGYSMQETMEKVFVLEEKITRKASKAYANYARQAHVRGEISIRKYYSLVSRFKEDWIISDSMNFSFSRSGAARIMKTCIDNNPWKKYRIVEIEDCFIHNERGIALIDFDYKRAGVSRMGIHAEVYVMKARIKSIYRCVFADKGSDSECI